MISPADCRMFVRAMPEPTAGLTMRQRGTAAAELDLWILRRLSAKSAA
jgi:hypothetical protein